MKTIVLWPAVLAIFFFWEIASGHFTEKGHVHTLSKKQQAFFNPDCRSTDTCDLKRFTLTQSTDEVWFSDDPNYPTYGNSVIMEYETASVDALEKYAVVQFKKGCVFHTSKNGKGKIERNVLDVVTSFEEDVPFCFPQWVIDSQDSDPVYNSDPVYGRFHLLRWNTPGSYDERTQKYYGVEKPEIPILYMADHPAGAFVGGTAVRNVALEFNTCIYKAGDVPVRTRRDDIHFAKPLNCFEWQNVYVYDFDRAAFHTDLAYAPTWDGPSGKVNLYATVILAALFATLIFGAAAVVRKKRRRKQPS